MAAEDEVEDAEQLKPPAGGWGYDAIYSFVRFAHPTASAQHEQFE